MGLEYVVSALTGIGAARASTAAIHAGVASPIPPRSSGYLALHSGRALGGRRRPFGPALGCLWQTTHGMCSWGTTNAIQRQAPGQEVIYDIDPQKVILTALPRLRDPRKRRARGPNNL